MLTRNRDRIGIAAVLGAAVCLGVLAGALMHGERGARTLSCQPFVLAFTFFLQGQRGLARRLRRAIRKGELTVAYQPLVDLNTRAVVGAEALARWTSDSDGAVSPDVFVKAAEGEGFVSELTQFILHRVVDEFDDLLRRGSFAVTVNIAMQDLNEASFFEVLSQCVRSANIKPATIGFDLAERATADRVAAIRAIGRLKSAGHRVYIDDFGTGFSSLSYLQRLAADGIKIDRGFTSAVGTQSANAAAVPQLLDMASQLNLTVVVEGIETEEQLAYFRQAGRGILGQGWLFGAPVPAAEFKKHYAPGVKYAVAASSAKALQA